MGHNSIRKIEDLLVQNEDVDIPSGKPMVFSGADGIKVRKILPDSGTTLTLGDSTTTLVNSGVGGATIFQANEVKPLTHLTIGNLVDIGLGITTATGTGDVAAAATMVGRYAKITTATQTTAAGAITTLTITAGSVLADDLVFASVKTAGTGMPCITKVTSADGSLVIVIQNIHATVAFNAALVLSIIALGPA